MWKYLILAFIAGLYSGIYLFIYISGKYEKKYKKEIEDAFSKILDNFLSISFTKRINNYAYFSYDNLEIIYQLDNKVISVFNNEECLISSKQLNNNKIIEELINKIEKKWDSDINNVIIVNNMKISANYVEEQTKMSIPFLQDILPNKDEFTIDEILDKINEVGYENLTKDEMEFLKNASK